MANYSNLKEAIAAAIKQNGNQEITGQVLQDVLTSMVYVIGANYTFAGVATPATNPGTPDQNVFYLAMEGGTYTNFNGTVLPAGISLLMWNGTWTSKTVMCGDGGVFDISVYKSSGGTLATFADLAAALDGGNNIPASARNGGMSVKFVQSSDNKYVQYRLMADDWSTDTDDWAIAEDTVLIENPEWSQVVTDSNDKILYGVKTDNNFYFGKGCPKQVKSYISQLLGTYSASDYADIMTFLGTLINGDTLTTLLNGKVAKEEGKSLINADFASSQDVIENPEWVKLLTYSENNILEGWRNDGKGTKVNFTPEEDYAIYKDYIENPEFFRVLTNRQGGVFSGRDKDGKLHEFVGIVSKKGGFKTASIEILNVLKHLVLTAQAKKNISEDLEINFNVWTGKNIAWYGTSIPAGQGNIILPITGNAINAYLAYDGKLYHFEDGQNLPSEYPVIAASLMGADTVYNHCQPSSRLMRNLTEPNIRYRGLALMNTAKNNLDTVFGAYNIDTSNKTFSRNTDNTVGITTWYDSEYEQNWNSFAKHTIEYIGQSYEIRLIARHLIGEDNSDYLHTILGTYYNDIATMLSDVGKTMDDFAGYIGDVQLIVLEHSVNDPISTSTPVNTDNIDSFAGAYSQIIDIIRYYKPSMRIGIAANYIDFGEPNNIEANDYLREIARYHSTPFIDMRDFSQVSWAKQLTCGYWDANGYWHDSGFEWSEDEPNDSYTTNATFPADIRSTSLAQMKENINPHQVNGVWCWESAELYQWVADGIHPFSDKTGRLTILIGRVFAEFLPTIGDFK